MPVGAFRAAVCRHLSSPPPGAVGSARAAQWTVSTWAWTVTSGEKSSVIMEAMEIKHRPCILQIRKERRGGGEIGQLAQGRVARS